MVEIGALILIFIGAVILFMWFTGTLDDAADWVWNLMKSMFR